MLLEIRATAVANRGNSYYYKSRQNYRKSGKLLQVGVELLQNGTAITNRSNYYKLLHNKGFCFSQDKMRKIYETKVRQLESMLSVSKKQEEKTQDELVKLREEIR